MIYYSIYINCYWNNVHPNEEPNKSKPKQRRQRHIGKNITNSDFLDKSNTGVVDSNTKR